MLKSQLAKKPPTKEPGIIHKKEIEKPNNSDEKLIHTATAALMSVPINVPVDVARRKNIATKKGTNSGATSRLMVLYVISSKLPLILPITRLITTITTPIATEINWASFTCFFFTERVASLR